MGFEDLLKELKISKKEFGEFKKSVSNSKGNVLLIVHPFFQEQINPHPSDYLEYKKRVIATMKGSKRPIIVKEEWGEIKKTRTLLNKLGIRALIIPTISQNAMANTLSLKERHIYGRIINRMVIKESEKIAPTAALLKMAGVQGIQLGGSLSLEETSVLRRQIISFFESKWLPKRLVPKVTIGKGCLGATYSRLINYHAKDFKKIKLMPKLCYPQEPEFGKPKPKRKKSFKQIKRR